MRNECIFSIYFKIISIVAGRQDSLKTSTRTLTRTKGATTGSRGGRGEEADRSTPAGDSVQGRGPLGIGRGEGLTGDKGREDCDVIAVPIVNNGKKDAVE